MPVARRQFTAAEDAILRRTHAGEIRMLDATRQLRTSLQAIYRRFEELGLPPKRKPSARSARSTRP